MSLKGRVENGVVKLDEPQALPDGTVVEVQPLVVPPRTTSASTECFVAPPQPFDRQALESMRADLTREQYEALLAIACAGGADVEAIRKIRAASMI